MAGGALDLVLHLFGACGRPLEILEKRTIVVEQDAGHALCQIEESLVKVAGSQDDGVELTDMFTFQ